MWFKLNSVLNQTNQAVNSYEIDVHVWVLDYIYFKNNNQDFP